MIKDKIDRAYFKAYEICKELHIRRETIQRIMNKLGIKKTLTVTVYQADLIRAEYIKSLKKKKREYEAKANQNEAKAMQLGERLKRIKNN